MYGLAFAVYESAKFRAVMLKMARPWVNGSAVVFKVL